MTEQDTVAIIQVINLYGLAIDSRRWDLFDEVFTRDVEAIYSSGSHWRDLATFKAEFAAAHAPLHHTQHAMYNHVVKVAGDAAQAFTYVAWRLVGAAADGACDLREGSAWYDDELLRTDGRWLIGRRHCRVTWWRRWSVGADDMAAMAAENPTRQVRDEAAAGTIPILRAIGPRR